MWHGNSRRLQNMDNAVDTKALWDISYGLYLVTSVSGEKVNGQIVNSIIQVCAETPRIAVSINKENLTHEYIKKSGVLAVTVLEQDTPMPFIGRFGFRTGRDEDKFSEMKYEKGQTGCPIVTDNALSYFEGKVIGSADAGTHTVFIVEITEAKVLKEGIPLTYAHYQQVKKGKAPKNAPTYRGNVVKADTMKEK
jgi:ferric-chelate reductase [NAD(P)H]